MPEGNTIYSDTIMGDRRKLTVRFDMIDGYLGINQYDDGALTDRVLLSPDQVAKLFRFVSAQKHT